MKREHDELKTAYHGLIEEGDRISEMLRKLGNGNALTPSTEKSLRAAMRQAYSGAAALVPVIFPALRVIVTNRDDKTIMDDRVAMDESRGGYWFDDPPKHLYDLVDQMRDSLNHGDLFGIVRRGDAEFWWKSEPAQ